MPFHHFIAALLGFSLSAAAATVRAYVQPATAQTNQGVNYVITVEGGELQAVPQLRLPSQIRSNPAFQQSQNVVVQNGVSRVSMSFSWQIAGTEPGEYTLPPQDLLIDGQAIKTNEVKFVVTEAPASPAMPQGDELSTPLFQIEVGKTELYQGEVVPLNASLYIPRRVALRRVGLIDLTKSDFAVARFPQNADQSETVINGVGYVVYTYRTTLSPLQAGDLKVGPASVELVYEVMDERQRMPGFPFGAMMGVGEPRKQVVKSQEVKVKALPLPKEGRPISFTGAVGDFSIEASASPTELAVGDPLAVELVVEGIGNFDAINAPALTQPEGWRPYPPRRYNIDGPQDPNQLAAFLPPGSPRRIGFSQVFVPEKQHVQLPPFELTFFSPSQKKYVSVSTAPVVLNVKPGTAPAAEGVTGAAASPEAAKPPPVMQPRPNLQDIVIRVPDQPRWLSTVPPISVLASSRFWAAQGIPLLVLSFATFAAWMRQRRERLASGLRGELLKLWAGLEEGGLDDRTFLQRAAWFIQRAHEGNNEMDEASRAVIARYEAQNFTIDSAQVLTLSERRSILGSLRRLLQAAAALLVLAFTSGSLQAAATDEAANLYQQARESLMQGKFTKAQYAAERILKLSPPPLSAEVFSILGHTRFKQDDMGRAALWYQRAALLDPANTELQQNLRLLDERLRFFTLERHSPVALWSLRLAVNQWAFLAAAGGWLIVLALAWRVWMGRASPLNAGRRLVALLAALCGFLIVIPATTFAAMRPMPAERVRDVMVVTQPEVGLYAAATVTSASNLDLPVGSQVRLLEKRGAWSYVEVPVASDEPTRGWVESSVIQPLWPWDEALLP
ncbi:MAG: BatD family protein [Prosthecobacter sp.]